MGTTSNANEMIAEPTYYTLFVQTFQPQPYTGVFYHKIEAEKAARALARDTGKEVVIMKAKARIRFERAHTYKIKLK
jgi:hypothetical protein